MTDSHTQRLEAGKAMLQSALKVATSANHEPHKYRSIVVFLDPKDDAKVLISYLSFTEANLTVQADAEPSDAGLRKVWLTSGTAFDVKAFAQKHGVSITELDESENVQQSWVNFVTGPLQTFASRAK